MRPQGRRGEVVAEVLTDFPTRFAALRKAYLESSGGKPDPVDVENAWLHKRRVVIKFFDVDSIESAERLRGRHVLIPRKERIELPAHHYYLWELEGCRVVRQREGGEVGTVTAVERTGGVDLLRVEPSDGSRGEMLVPLAQAICTRIDPAAKTIWIDPPEDLLDVNR